MFRFNPGQNKKVFPPNNAYTKVVGADSVKKELKNEKTVKYKNVSSRELKNIYQEQNFDKNNEDIIMGRKSEGYVQTINSFLINEKLRLEKPLSDNDKKVVNALDNLIKTNKLKDNLMLYRNVRNDFIKTIFGVKSSGNISQIINDIKKTNITTYTDKGFTSVSAIKEDNVFQERPIHLEIQAKKGTNAFVTSNYIESEIILGRNQKMKIIEVLEENGKIKFIMETS